MKQFFSYLKSRWKTAALFFLFALIQMLVFSLYRMPAAPALYAISLCMVIGLAALIWDYCQVSRWHRILSRIQTAADAMLCSLPDPEGILDADYQQVIRLLCQEQRSRVQDMNRKYQDMTDYYTIWAHQIKPPSHP